MSSATMPNLFENLAPAIGNAGGEAYTGRGVATPLLDKPLGSVIEFPRREYVARVLEDRWYQTKAIEEIRCRLPKGVKRRGGKGELLVSPTGCGKTSIASRVIGGWLEDGERVLILTDLERLLDQMRDDLGEEGIYPLIEKAHHSARKDFGLRGKCVLASMQTLYTDRLQTWPRDSFDKIVIDEAHELRWTKITDWFSAPYLGLTATPIRADGKSLKEHFHYPYIRTLTMREAIEGWDGIVREDESRTYGNPFLSRIRLETIPAPGIDISQIRLVGKDFDAREMDRLIWENTNYLATAILENAGDRHPFIYCPKIASATAIAEALRDLGASAAAYTSDTPDPADVLKRFIKGDIQFLTNVNMLIKGINVPFVDAIFRVRASLNVGQATQEIGRGTRLCPETGKKDCVVYEFDYETGGQRLASVLDAILDGADDPDKKPTKAEGEWRGKVRERMETLVKSGEETDVIRAYDKAQKQLSFEEIEEKRKKDEARRAKYERVQVAAVSFRYDPFAGLDKQGTHSSQARTTTPATAEQMRQLETLSKGIIKSDRDTKEWCAASAAKRISDLEIRAKHKYATEPQLRLMIDTLGFEPKVAQRMRKWEASAAIEARMLEMAGDIEASGQTNKPFEELKTMKPWELAPMHKRLCGAVDA